MRLNTRLVAAVGLVAGVVVLRTLRNRRSETDDESAVVETDPETARDQPRTASEHATVAVEHARLAFKKAVEATRSEIDGADVPLESAEPSA